jgi:hypothetical protein
MNILRIIASPARLLPLVVATIFSSVPAAVGEEAASALPLPPLSTTDVASNEPSRSALPSMRHNVQADLAGATVELGAVEVPANTSTTPLQVGVNRIVQKEAVEVARRYPLRNGGRLTVLAIRSPGAAALRVKFSDFAVSREEEVWVRGSKADGMVAGPYNGDGPWNDGTFWSATVEGDTAIIEHYSPAGAEGSFRVSAVSHIYSGIVENRPEALECHEDASCNPEGPRDAVARLTFVSDGGSYVCTGTLLSTTDQSRIPYVLTANHCVGNQEEARSVEAHWHYQTRSCNSGSLRTTARTTGGANLLATSRVNDATLVQLVNDVPATVAFAGWSAATLPIGTDVLALHHPSGGVPPQTESFLRKSRGIIAGDTEECPPSGLVNGYFVEWSLGAAEPGSSGSGIFMRSPDGTLSTLVGILSCGPGGGSCSFLWALYGRFSLFYAQIAQYLNPPTLANAVDAPQLIWTTGGDKNWFGQLAITRDGLSAAQSGPIHHNQESWIQTTVTGPGTLTFWWKVSSESNYDWFRFRINGTELLPRISGEVDWTRRAVTIPAGVSTLRWTYSKDWSLSRGADAGWLDQVVFSSSVKADFDGNRTNDLIWQNNANGQRAIWFMNGTTFAGEHFLPTVATAWSIAATGDFNRDGHTDLLWQNNVTGQRAIWLMNRASRVQDRSLPTIPVQWQIAGAGDFDRDGHTDILWQNTVTGQRAIWLMHDTAWIGERFLPTVPPEWQIAATGSFNAGGHVDIVWQNTTTGQRAIWLMNGISHAGERFLPNVPTQWQIAGTGDFNGDAQTDIIWQNTTTGQRAIWLMNGTSYVGERFLLDVPTQWEIRNR